MPGNIARVEFAMMDDRVRSAFVTVLQHRIFNTLFIGWGAGPFGFLGQSANWRRGIAGLALLAVMLAGCRLEPSLEEKRKRAAEREKQRQAQLQEDLRNFAQEEVPQLQKVMDELTEELERRNKSLQELGRELQRFGDSPQEDPDWRRWNKAVYELRKVLDRLGDHRKQAYLAYRKFQLSSGSNVQFQARVQDAEQEAARIRAAFREMLTQFEEAVATEDSVIPPESQSASTADGLPAARALGVPPVAAD